MSGMEPATTNRPTREYPRTPDGKYKYTAWDGSPRYLEPYTIPDIIGPNFLIPAVVTRFLRKLFRHADTRTAR
jgi:hypothetical protein